MAASSYKERQREARAAAKAEKAALEREMAARVEARRLAMLAVKREIKSAGLRKLASYRMAELSALANARVDPELIELARERMKDWFSSR